MECQEFKDWVGSTGVVEAARLISEHEIARGAKGIAYQSLQDWLKTNIPPTRILAVEAVSGISRHDLNSEIYPRDAA